MINPWQNTRSCMPGKDRSSGAGIFITAFYAWAAITWNCSHDIGQLFIHIANVYNLSASPTGRQKPCHWFIFLGKLFSDPRLGWNERIIRCCKVESGLKGLKGPFHTICTRPGVFPAFTQGGKWIEDCQRRILSIYFPSCQKLLK